MKFHGQGTGLELRSAALDRMYGEGLSTALAVHLLREYGAAVLGPKRQYGGLPREKLVRPVEYIQDQLDTDLTVSGIAQAVGISPDHFTRLFKESTGQLCRPILRVHRTAENGHRSGLRPAMP